METFSRPAVRVVCFDAGGRVLMLHWRDPHDGHLLWEPPGGGIDPGETPLQAARRELSEETGLDPAAIDDRFVPVARDTVWKGKRFVGDEQFFPAYFRTSRPVVSRAGLLPYEESSLIGSQWVACGDLTGLPDQLEPPGLPAVIESLRATVIVLGGSLPGATPIRPVGDREDALEAAVALAAPGVVLVAYGPDAVTVARWSARGATGVAGAVLVDPPAGARLPFPSIVVLSAGSRSSAESWGSRLVEGDPVQLVPALVAGLRP